MLSLEGFLREHGEADWARAVSRAAALIGDEEAEGLYQFNRMFGGPLSLNDLVFESGNEEFRRRKSDAFDLAQEIKRAHLRL